MCATWVLTVVSLTWRRWAISALVSPFATSFSTSRSRSVSVSNSFDLCGTGSGRLANSSISRFVTDGASSASPAATTRMALIRSSGGAALRRNAEAPAASASKTYSSSSEVGRLPTRVRPGTGRFGRISTGAVVADRHQQRIRLVLDDNLDPAGVGVLEHVGDRLLDDPIGGQFERRGQRPFLAGDFERGLQAGLACGLQQRLGLVERGLRGQRRAGALAQDAEEAVELGKRRPRARFDRLQRLRARAARDPRRAGPDRQ